MENNKLLQNSQVSSSAKKFFGVTENGDPTFISSGTNCLDLFALGGSMRSFKDSDILDHWNRAYQENPLLALKLLFLIRSPREGHGERRVFRVIWNSLDTRIKQTFWSLVPEVGRYDDLQETILTDPYIAQQIKMQLISESSFESKTTLLAKWLPCGRGNKTAKEETKKMAKALGFAEKEYRKIITTLRKNLNLTETYMCTQQWDAIKYESVPSQAMRRYSIAFTRNDTQRFGEYLKDVQEGKKKINTSVSLPHEIVHDLLLNRGLTDTEAYEVLWKSLPDYTQGKED